MKAVYVYCLMAVGVMAMSLAGPVVRLSSAPAVVLAVYRLGISGVLLGVVALARPASNTLTKRQWILAASSGIALGLHYLLWFVSLRMTTVASSTVLVTMHPLVVLGFTHYVFRERIPVRSLVALAISLLGAYVISAGDLRLSAEHLLGDLAALGAMLMMAGYLLIGSRLRRSVDVIRYTAIVYSSGAVLLLAVALLQGVRLFGYSSGDVGVFVFLALGPNVIGHGLINWSLGFVKPTVVSMSILAEPVIATLIAWALLGEMPGPAQSFGGMMVLTGITLYLWRRPNGSKQVVGDGAKESVDR